MDTKMLLHMDRAVLVDKYCLPPKFRSIEMERTLRVPPSLLNLSDAVRGELVSLYVDKVIAPLGFCVSVGDIHSIVREVIPLVDGDGDGSPTYTVKFSLMMFSPIAGEVIATAKLLKSTKKGLRLSLGFFDDIYVPRDLLPKPCHHWPDRVNKGQVRWIWNYMCDDSAPQYIDHKYEITFKVVGVRYPSSPPERENVPTRLPRMIVKASIDGFGLGPARWWC